MAQTPAEAAEDAYWGSLYGRWEPLDLAGVATFMAGFDRPWWVVGGWAIDAFARDSRQHQDVDVSILASDVAALRQHVGDRWHLWNLAGEQMKPLTDRHPDVFDPASQVWVRAHGDAPWVLDVPLTPDAAGLWTNKFMPDHCGPIDDLTWEADDRIRYLDPEIVLWFKARKRRTKDEQDFVRTWPHLSPEQRVWLREMIRRSGDSHPWLRMTG